MPEPIKDPHPRPPKIRSAFPFHPGEGPKTLKFSKSALPLKHAQKIDLDILRMGVGGGCPDLAVTGGRGFQRLHRYFANDLFSRNRKRGRGSA